MRIDHFQHLLASWILVDAIAPFTGLHVAMLIVLFISAMKEIIWDGLMARGDADWFDFIAGALGVCIAVFEWSGSVLLGLWAFWILYVFTMGMYRAKLQGRMKGLSLILASPFIVLALLLDVLAQFSVFSVAFFEWPRHLLVTSRLQAHMAGPDGWRRRLAENICRHLLDPFDPTGAHCDSRNSPKA